MDAAALLDELKSLGSEQTRKTYIRHGATGDIYGVSYANFNALTKRYRNQTDLAEALWASGNYDARVLATMIADGKNITLDTLLRWAEDLDSYAVSDAYVGLVIRSPYARELMERWLNSDHEWQSRVSWRLVGEFGMKDKEHYTDEHFVPYLAQIEREIHSRKNYVRDGMNGALICIGLRSPEMTQKALEAAKRIGKVHVDHGQTACETPDAAAYIHRTLDRQNKKPVRKTG